MMEKQVAMFTAWLVETNEGTSCVPADLLSPSDVPHVTIAEVRDYCEGEPLESSDGFAEAERVTGWFHRLSMPGYMDCTEWTGPFETQEEAEEDHVNTWEDGEEEEGEGEPDWTEGAYGLSDCVNYASNRRGDCGGRMVLHDGVVRCEVCWNRRHDGDGGMPALPPLPATATAGSWGGVAAEFVCTIDGHLQAARAVGAQYLVADLTWYARDGFTCGARLVDPRRDQALTDAERAPVRAPPSNGAPESEGAGR